MWDGGVVEYMSDSVLVCNGCGFLGDLFAKMIAIFVTFTRLILLNSE